MIGNFAVTQPTFADVRAALRARFGVDPRALAAMRVGLGTLLLADLFLRARSLRAFYTDAGALPRAELARLYPAYRSISIHAVSGEAWVQALLFALAGAFAVALLVGYRTRLATLGSLVLLVSLHARNPMVLNAGDVLLRRLLFWGLFLPLGSRWAVDARGRDGPAEWIAGVAAAGLLIQVVLVYAANVAFKLRDDVWLRGEAIRYVLELEEYTVGVGPTLAEFPGVVAALTWTWLALVVCSGLLLVLTGRARTLLAACFAAGHVGMALTMDLGVFPFVSLVALLPFVSPAGWDRVAAHVRPVIPDDPGLNPRRPFDVEISGGPRIRAVRSGLLAFVIVSLLATNAFATGVVDAPTAVPDAVEDRSWNMFGNPPRADVWYVATDTGEDGTETSARADAPRRDRPPDDGAGYPNARWRKYQIDLAARDDERLHARFAADICRRWKDAGGDPVRRVALSRVTERTNLAGPDRRTTEVVGRYECGNGDPTSGVTA